MSADAWRVEVTPECIASGVCLALAGPDFVAGEDGQTRPVREVIEPREAVADAAASCPMEAILLTDASTGAPVAV